MAKKTSKKTTTKKGAAAKTSKSKRSRRASRSKSWHARARGAVYNGYKAVANHSATPVVAGVVVTAATSVLGTVLYFKRFV